MSGGSCSLSAPLRRVHRSARRRARHVVYLASGSDVPLSEQSATSEQESEAEDDDPPLAKDA